MDGTPILDIKPYLPYVDCMPDARGGFADRVKGYALEVEIPEKLLLKLPNEQQGCVQKGRSSQKIRDRLIRMIRQSIWNGVCRV